jgi:glutamine---fructose-6-phosphate transaminase (isomerizing)
MCGIYGCIKKNTNNINIGKFIFNGLNLLKNRGYDSCGIYLYHNYDQFIEKFGIDGDYINNNQEKSDIFDILEDKLNSIKNPEEFILGIGHTRWATHGMKTDYNSHPHFSNDNTVKIVHNGIISNFNDLKQKYLENYHFKSNTDTEVIANMIQYLKTEYIKNNSNKSMVEILEELSNILEGTWACIIFDTTDPSKLYFIKNENPLLIASNENVVILTSEPSGFMNEVDKYILLRDKTYGYVDDSGFIKIFGDYKELSLIKLSKDEIVLSNNYKHWMYKEILDQSKLNVLIDPITNKLRYSQSNVLFNFDYIKSCKYLYIIACGSSYYAGLIASNYFRFTKAFEFVNVFDGGEFTKSHLETIENPEENLLVILISQSGETRDLNIATTICREFSSNRKNILKPNSLINKNDSFHEIDEKIEINNNGEIKIIGIINVIGSLISRRTIDNIYTNCGRENAVASTKSCTSQILSCLLLAIYKSSLNNKLNVLHKKRFINDLNTLGIDILQIIENEDKIKDIASFILEKNKSSIFLLGKDELHGAALEGALKIKEISYIHAEGFNITALKHGPYALIEKDTPIIVIYKDRDHFVKSILEEIKTRGAYVIEISSNAPNDIHSFILPLNKTFTGLLSVVTLQLLSYFLSVKKNINPDQPRNLAKVVTVD